LLGRKEQSGSKNNRFHYLPRFYMDRFVRLTPALALMVLGITYLCIHGGVAGYAQILPDAFSAFFYLHNIYPIDSSPHGMMVPGMFLNTWSLAVEEQFYIVWSVLFSFVVFMPESRRLKTMLSLTAISFGVRYVSGYAFMTPYMHGIDYRFSWSANVWKMFMGCTVRLLPVPAFTLHTRLGAAATLVLCVLFYAWGWGLQKLNFDYRTDGAWLELLSSLVVVQVILGSLSGNAFLEAPFFRFPGRISYSLYLWQFPLQAYFGWPLYDWIPTFLAFAIASFTTFYIEEPTRNAYRARMRTMTKQV
jgi:peptidoglycan/LPS O-acetylase OafA/YrhL